MLSAYQAIIRRTKSRINLYICTNGRYGPYDYHKYSLEIGTVSDFVLEITTISQLVILAYPMGAMDWAESKVGALMWAMRNMMPDKGGGLRIAWHRGFGIIYLTESTSVITVCAVFLSIVARVLYVSIILEKMEGEREGLYTYPTLHGFPEILTLPLLNTNTTTKARLMIVVHNHLMLLHKAVSSWMLIFQSGYRQLPSLKDTSHVVVADRPSSPESGGGQFMKPHEYGIIRSTE